MKIDINKVINKFKNNSLNSKNEEDVRINTNIFLDGVSDFYDLNKSFSSEISSLQGGRADSIYSDVIFEFKKPKKFQSQAGEDEAIYGRDGKDRGLYSYLVNFSLDELGKGDDEYFEQILLSKVGVAFDGKTFIFFRYKKSNKTIDLLINQKTKKFPKNIQNKRELTYEIEKITDFDLGVKNYFFYKIYEKKKVIIRKFIKIILIKF